MSQIVSSATPTVPTILTLTPLKVFVSAAAFVVMLSAYFALGTLLVLRPISTTFTMAAICAFPCHIVMIVVYRIILWVCGSPDAAAIDHFITASVSAATIVFSLVANQWQALTQYPIATFILVGIVTGVVTFVVLHVFNVGREMMGSFGRLCTLVGRLWDQIIGTIKTSEGHIYDLFNTGMALLSTLYLCICNTIRLLVGQAEIREELVSPSLSTSPPPYDKSNFQYVHDDIGYRWFKPHFTSNAYMLG